jgi:hypothetical protein
MRHCLPATVSTARIAISDSYNGRVVTVAH